MHFFVHDAVALSNNLQLGILATKFKLLPEGLQG